MTDLEAQKTPPSRVIVTERIPDIELTAAFQYADTLLIGEDFVGRNKRFAISSRGSRGVKDGYAIMIRQKLNRLAVWFLILSGAFVCILAGILVGALAKSVDLGAS